MEVFSRPLIVWDFNLLVLGLGLSKYVMTLSPRKDVLFILLFGVFFMVVFFSFSGVFSNIARPKYLSQSSQD